VLSPENGSFASVAGGISLADLTPAPRRQDHTALPYATSVFVQHALACLTLPASTASHPAFVTIAIRPLLGWDGNIYTSDLGFGKTEIFLQKGLDSRARYAAN
jgi:hypothetical protein